ncbi:MAG TPA: hypothetical protein VHP33_18615 [Polyangiaceae bacterium]|nr:hypothetical protein [Polyangiaceae bacterium]
MGDSPRSVSSSGLRLLLRLMSVLAALLVLSVSSRASAASRPGTDKPVPMCGDRNESIAAPPIFRGSHDTALRAGPCQAPDELGTTRGAPLAPERVIVQQRPERVLAFGALGVAQSESSRVSIAGASREPKRPGFVGTPFRPPCP